MAIPGMRPTFNVRAKVRCGIKGKTASGKEIPKSVDYFVSDDAEFPSGNPKSLTITFPHPRASDNFRSGLEQWEGKLLLCYNDGSRGEDVALRKRTMKKGGSDVDTLAGFTVLSDQLVGQDRAQVTCLARGCPMLVAKKCKPTGRLTFFIDGLNPLDGVFEFPTHSWNTIEGLEGFMRLLDAKYKDVTGMKFLLHVKFEQRGRDRFPVVWLEEADVEINNDYDVSVADSLIALRKAVEIDGDVRAAFAKYLDASTPSWKENERLVAKIKELGVDAAARSALERAGA